MRIIVLSDTHGNPKVLETILARHADADACIHLGDGEGDVKLFLSCHPEWESKFYAVRGNCDFNSSLPISRTIDRFRGIASLPYTDTAMRFATPPIFW